MSDLTTLTDRIRSASTNSHAMDAVMDTLDDECLAGNLDGVADWLGTCVNADFSIAILLGVLTITWPWQAALVEQRSAVAAHIRQRDPQRADKLLRGLLP